jgi:hypothetical protein
MDLHPLQPAVTVRPSMAIEKSKRRRETLTRSAPGSIANDHRSSSLLCTTLGFTARLAHVAAYTQASDSSSNRERARATGLASSVISKMRSSLSMRGITRR